MNDKPLQLGWEEWVALPDLGLPAIKAKIDTGARTSALHAFRIEPYGTAEAPMVRFAVQPVPGRGEIVIWCSAPVVDRREVTSSNGERELRYVIASDLLIAGRRWPIEVTLSNRDGMAYRMLVGRQAIQAGVVVDPTRSFLQPRASHAVYKSRTYGPGATGPAIRIACLTGRPDNASNRLLREAAEAAGCTFDLLDRRSVSLLVEPHACSVLVDGAELDPYGAVIARSSDKASSFGVAVVRQLEIAGAYAINPSSALMLLRDPLAALQTLAASNLPCPTTAISAVTKTAGEDRLGVLLAADLPRRGAARVARVLVVGEGRAAALERTTGDLSLVETSSDWQRAGSGEDVAEAGRIAERTARALGLGLAGVDLVETHAGWFIAGVTGTPSLAMIAKASGSDVGARIIGHIMDRVAGESNRSV